MNPVNVGEIWHYESEAEDECEQVTIVAVEPLFVCIRFHDDTRRWVRREYVTQRRLPIITRLDHDSSLWFEDGCGDEERIAQFVAREALFVCVEFSDGSRRWVPSVFTGPPHYSHPRYPWMIKESDGTPESVTKARDEAARKQKQLNAEALAKIAWSNEALERFHSVFRKEHAVAETYREALHSDDPKRMLEVLQESQPSVCSKGVCLSTATRLVKFVSVKDGVFGFMNPRCDFHSAPLADAYGVVSIHELEWAQPMRLILDRLRSKDAPLPWWCADSIAPASMGVQLLSFTRDELVALENGTPSDSLKARIRSALTRLE